MTTYYTTAKAHGGKYLKIPIEAKHVYKNTPSPVQVLTDNYGGSTTAANYHNGYRATPESAIILYDNKNDPWRWTRGPGPQDIIGDKIMVKSVNFHFEIYLKNDAFVKSPDSDISFMNTTTTQAQNSVTQNPILVNNSATNEPFQAVKNTAWRRDYRLQVIHFENELPSTASAPNALKNRVAEWFSQTYVPQKYNTGAAASWADYGYSLLMSNKVKMLRESTSYTGKFKIIKDIEFSLNQSKTYQIIDFQLDPKKQVNMTTNDGINYTITNDWWLNTVIVLWQPMNYDLDMDPLSAAILKGISSSSYSSFNIGEITKSIKLTYYDV